MSRSIRRAAIVAPLRTPVGRFLGSLSPLPAERLAELMVRAVIERSAINPETIDDVVFAQSYANSEAPCIGRWAGLAAGLPVTVPGCQVDRRCGGGLQALATAAMMIETGAADVVLAGGVESMSNIEYYTTAMRSGARSGTVRLYDRLDRGRERSQPEARFGAISGMVETAENLAREFAIGREEADEFATQSHRRAAAARESGRFDTEIVPVSVPTGAAEDLVSSDEGIRPDTTPDRLARLNPLIEGGTVTAGNSSQQNDAAAACLVVSEDRLGALGLRPMAFLVGWAAAGCEPARMGLGPIPAVARLFGRTCLDWDDIELIEINEAFAVQVLACLKVWKLDSERVNVNGSGISLGHPIGATGARIMTSLLHEMERRGSRYGLETMCIGGGQGMAALFERP